MPINNIALIIGYIQKASYSFNSFFCSKISLITIVANTTRSKSVTFDESIAYFSNPGISFTNINLSLKTVLYSPICKF